MEKLFELNLIKDRLEKQKLKKTYFNKFIIIYGVCFGVFALCAGLYFFNNARIKNNIKTIAATKQNIVNYKTSLNIFQLEKEWTGYNNSLLMIGKLMQKRTIWSFRLRQLSVLLPEGIALDTLSWAKDSENMRLRILSAPQETNALKLVDGLMSAFKKDEFFAQAAKLENQERVRSENNSSEVELFEIAIPCTGVTP
ncbi:MAG: hypothetical protein LHV68_09025 [Elusimicrobia bacterium]|nr:hypothetical protein [Candidatus Liberimonas magnetica]